VADYVVASSAVNCNNERIIKIGSYCSKLSQKTTWVFYFDSRCRKYFFQICFECLHFVVDVCVARCGKGRNAENALSARIRQPQIRKSFVRI